MQLAEIVPVDLYGSSISYFTGKLENYFRIKGIPYRLHPITSRDAPVIRQQVGSSQMPAVRLADGRWMSDSSAIIQWFERLQPSPAVIPGAPLPRFFSLLLEDYADEWLWRPAMHFRWYYQEGARWAGCHLANELAASVPVPAFLKRCIITRRQRQGYTMGDGITRDQVPGVEAIYHRTLAQLEAIFRKRPFLLGDNPGLADIGFSGPMFRHFGLDPIPAEIMRQQAPAVWEWSARLWNSQLPENVSSPANEVPDDWGPILNEIGTHYLPYLCANADAVAAGSRKFDVEVGGVHYRGARWSKYRVWCLQRLRDHYRELADDDQQAARALLERHGCWEPLWRQADLPINPGLCGRLPFHVDAKMIDVYD